MTVSLRAAAFLRGAAAALLAAAGLSSAWADDDAIGEQPLAADRLEQAFFLEQALGDKSAAAVLYRQLAADPQAGAQVKAVAGERLAEAARLTVKAENPAAQGAAQPAGQDGGQEDKLVAAVKEAAAAIQANYAFDAPSDKLLSSALEGMLSALDGESSYLSAAEVREMSQGIDQQLVGVGLQLKFEEGQVKVVAPVPGSPAEKAGFVPGDVVVAVGDKKLADLPEGDRLVSAVKMIRGPAGEKVSIGVQSGDEHRLIAVERAAIELESVRGDQREGGAWKYFIDDDKKIAYVRILQFGRRTSQELRTVLEKLLADGMKGLVLDLRDNGGGLLGQAVETADLFLSTGQIVTVKGKDGKTNVFEAKAEGTLADFPLAVIVNRNTASSAEIVAASLQDHGRAVVVGERTFGRGVVQSIVPLTSTGGALKLTSAVYTRPSGKSLKRQRVEGRPREGDNEGGVFPSDGFAVEQSEEELRRYHQYRQQRDFPLPGAASEQFRDAALERALAAVKEKLN